eukprot:6018196-Amphidinium_carterae.1
MEIGQLRARIELLKQARALQSDDQKQSDGPQLIGKASRHGCESVWGDDPLSAVCVMLSICSEVGRPSLIQTCAS